MVTPQPCVLCLRTRPRGILSCMPQLLELYALAEMARTRGDATWAVLDWCAKQPGDFTIDDMFKVYSAAGGLSGPTSFATIINHFVAKYDPNAAKAKHRDRAKYGLSQKRPLQITRQGRRGKGGAARYVWGLDGPLREPPPDYDPSAEGDGDDDPVSQAMDALEQKMGAPALKAAMSRWRKMRDMRQVTADVRTLPPKLQMNALLVASQHLMDAGSADEEDVEDAEQQLDPAAQQAGAEGPAKNPFTPGKPKASTSRPTQAPAPQPEPEDDDPSAEWEDDSGDKTQPDAASPFSSDQEEPGEDDSAGFDTDVPDGFFDGDAEYEQQPTPNGAQLQAMIVSGDRRFPATITWQGDMAVVQNKGGRQISPDSGWKLQVIDDKQYDDQYEEMVLNIADAWGDNLIEDEGGGEEPPAEPVDAAEPEEASDEVTPDEIDTSDYPDWLPPAKNTGTKGERAMYRLIDLHQNGGAELGATDSFWEALEGAEDEGDADDVVRDYFNRPGYLKKFMPDALAVAKEVMSGTSEDDEELPEEEPEQSEEEPEEGDDESESDGDEEEPEVGDDEEEAPAKSGPTWLPNADEDGSNAENAMYRLVNEADLEPDDEFYAGLRRAKDAVDAHRIISTSDVPKNLRKAALTVAKAIFEHDGRDWDTGKKLGSKKESRGLLSLFRLNESTEDEIVPSPSKRPIPGPTRTLPDYGMDESTLDPVDFAPRSGLTRVLKLRKC